MPAEVERRHGLRSNLFWTGLSAGSSQGALFLINVVVARLLHASEVADFLVILALSSLVPAMFSFGLERLGVVLLANSSVGHAAAVAKAMRRVTGLASIAAAAAAIALSVFVVSSDSLTIRLLAAFVVAAENARIMVADLPRAWARADLALVSGPAGPRLALLILLAAQLLSTTSIRLDTILLVQGVLSLSAALVGVVTVHRLSRHNAPAESPADGVEGPVGVVAVLREGWPLSVANSGLALLNQVDTLVVAFFFDPITVASYAVVSRMSNLIGNIKTMCNVALLPSLARRPRSRVDSDQQTRQARVAMSALFVILLLPTVVFVLFAPTMVGWLFGDTYAAASGVAWLLCLGQLTSVFFGLAGSFLLRDGQQRAIMWIQILTAAASTGLMIIGGAVGSLAFVAAASGLGTGGCALIMTFYLWNKSQIPSWFGFSARTRIEPTPPSEV